MRKATYALDKRPAGHRLVNSVILLTFALLGLLSLPVRILREGPASAWQSLTSGLRKQGQVLRRERGAARDVMQRVESSTISSRVGQVKVDGLCVPCWDGRLILVTFAPGGRPDIPQRLVFQMNGSLVATLGREAVDLLGLPGTPRDINTAPRYLRGTLMPDFLQEETLKVIDRVASRLFDDASHQEVV